jgi:hypothetical protein
MSKRYVIRIAPRLKNGDSRVRDYGRLPEEVKEGLRAIAKAEGKSMSWVKEQIIIDYFGLKVPKYIEEKSSVKTHKKAGTRSH